MTTNTITKKQRKISEKSLANLKPIKKGQILNPKGRPKQLLSKKERLLLLAEIAKHDIQKPVTAGHKIAAIHEQNLMEHIYDEKPQYQDNRTYNILVQDTETKDVFNWLLEGKRPQEIPQDAGGEGVGDTTA